jgi:oxygen-dependent protoporphyrinogen oxidase
VVGLWREARTGAADGEAAGFLSLRRGMGSLVDRLAQRLPSGALRTCAGVAALARQGEGFGIKLANGEALAAAALILTPPPAEAARLLTQLDPELGALVGGIRSGSSVTVALGFERHGVRHPLNGYGFVVPESAGRPLLACTWASSKFPGRAPAGRVLLRAFLAFPESLLERDDRHVVAVAIEALRPILGIEGDPLFARVHRWREALPRYTVGHPARMEGIERRLASTPGVWVAGAAYRGVGIPDCVRQGERAAEAACEHMSRVGAR